MRNTVFDSTTTNASAMQKTTTINANVNGRKSSQLMSAHVSASINVKLKAKKLNQFNQMEQFKCVQMRSLQLKCQMASVSVRRSTINSAGVRVCVACVRVCLRVCVSVCVGLRVRASAEKQNKLNRRLAMLECLCVCGVCALAWAGRESESETN